MSEIVNRDDSRMVQPGQRTRLAGEPLGECFVLADLGRQDFQRHQAVELLLAGLVDRPHAALAQKLEDFQLGKLPR